ncbi:MAG TPA: hypothetical protein VFI67_07795 [Sphingomicrobium sp.]|nr:hypothetical protein [Sphingomicrobium sp.]
MGAPGSGMKAADQPAAESLLTAFKNLSAAERRRHASVLNYWLSVRGDKEFPPLHDLDPLELSDAGPSSVLLELISGGHDAEVRHLGETLRDEAWPERIIDAPNPSVLACIAKKLPIVAISRDFLAFEDEYEGSEGKVRCSVTLLPLSAGGAWVDYVYALVSVDGELGKAAKPASGKKAKTAPTEAEVAEETPESAEEQEPVAEKAKEPVAEADDLADEIEASPAEEPVAEAEEPADHVEEPTAEVEEPVEEDEPVVESSEEIEREEPAAAAVSKAAPGFSKLLDSLAGLTGFYGSQPVKVEPVMDDEPAGEETEEQTAEEPALEEPVEQSELDEPVAEAAEPVEDEPAAEEAVAEVPAPKQAEQPVPVSLEGTLQNKLTEVRAKADEARMARAKANSALYEGLAAAYDFALDAEDAPEEYLRLVEAQGLKIQLRSPMKPVVKLAFAGMCDDATIKQLEAVLAWAFEEELPRGTLAERIESAGGIAPILQAKAA